MKFCIFDAVSTKFSEAKCYQNSVCSRQGERAHHSDENANKYIKQAKNEARQTLNHLGWEVSLRQLSPNATPALPNHHENTSLGSPAG